MGQSFPTLTIAWNYALNAKVADGAYLHFYISSSKGNYAENLSAPFLLDHASGARMAILGDNASADTLAFGSTNGLILDTGHSFNTVSGLTISGTGTDGVKVAYDAALSFLGKSNVSGFQNLVHAVQGASIVVNTDCTLSSPGNVSCLAEAGGSITARTLTITTTNQQATAYWAVNGGIIVAESTNVSGSNVGAEADNGGVIDVANSTFTTHGYPIVANDGTVNCQSSTFSDCPSAVYAENGGSIDAEECYVVDGNIGVLAAARGYVDVTNATLENYGYDLVATRAGVIVATNASYGSVTTDTGYGSYID